MYKIGVSGSLSNYFFSESVKALSQNNVIISNIDAPDLDFIFCVNDVRPTIKNSKIPIVTWIGERPTWLYLWKQFNSRCADLIFLTEKDFVEPVKKLVGHNNVYFLPLATSFKTNYIQQKSYKYEISFVGNTMQKQITDMEEEKTAFLKLPLKNNDCIRIKDQIKNLNFNNLDNTIYDLINKLSSAKQYILDFNNYSDIRQDLLYGYMGMILTQNRRIFILSGLFRLFPNIILRPSDWNDFINEATVDERIAYENINKFYFDSMININISSMHMPSSLNSRVFDVPINGSFLLTDYRDGIYDLFENDEIVTYHSLNELIEYIDFFKTNEAARTKIINKSLRRIDNSHRYSNRISFILEKFQNSLG